MHTKCFHVKLNQNSWPDNCPAQCSNFNVHVYCTQRSNEHLKKFNVNFIIHEFYDRPTNQPIDRSLLHIHIQLKAHTLSHVHSIILRSHLQWTKMTNANSEYMSMWAIRSECFLHWLDVSFYFTIAFWLLNSNRLLFI